MSWIKDQFKDMSFKGQAKNPLQLLINPMAVGTVGIATVKDLSDKNKGWFSNAFKGSGFSMNNKNGSPTQKTSSGIDDNEEMGNPNMKYYIIGAVVVLLLLALMAHKRNQTN